MKTSLGLLLVLVAQAWASAADAPANTWVARTPEFTLPEAVATDKSARWVKTDGFCDNLFRTKTNTLIIRTGVHSDTLGLSPGYYTNTTVEWDPATNKAPAIEVSNWGGGSYGKGKLLPAFKEHPTPSPRHTYDGICYVPGEDAMYLVLGANWKTCLGEGVEPAAKEQLVVDDKSTWKFSFETRRWTRIDGGVNSAGYTGSPYENHLTHWPEGNKLLFLNYAGNFYAEFDLEAQKWTKVPLKNKAPTSLWDARSTWDDKRGLWVFRLGPKCCTFDPKAKEYHALPDAYAVDDPKKDPRAGMKGMTYVAKHDVYLINGLTADDTWVFDPNKNTWSQLKANGPALINGYLQYDPRNDQVILSHQHTVFTLKYVP